MVLRALQSFFDSRVGDDAAGTTETDRVRLATAALFVEMTRIDHEISEVEDEAVLRSIERTLRVEGGEARELLRLARAEIEEAIELFQFTRLVDSRFSPERKVEVVERLWEVALADETLDEKEEHLVRKVANLLHVSHRDFIAAKKRARATHAAR